jgi:hypothetical protein
MAAEQTSEMAELGFAYERLARSLRQTLALKARLAREREPSARPAAEAPLWAATTALRTSHRERQVYEAVDAVIWAEHRAQRLDRPAQVLARLAERLAALAGDERFADTDPAALVACLCAELGLPAPDATPGTP